MHRFGFKWNEIHGDFRLKDEPEKGDRPSLCSEGVENYFPFLQGEVEFDMLLTDTEPADEGWYAFHPNMDGAWVDAEEAEDFGTEDAEETFDGNTDGWFYRVLGSECERFWVKLEAVDGLPTTDS